MAPDHKVGDEAVIVTLRDVLKGPVIVVAIGTRLLQTGIGVDVEVAEVRLGMAHVVVVVVGVGILPCVSVAVVDTVTDGVSEGSTV